MVQIGLAIMAISLIGAGIKALAGKEKPEKETPKPVAIALMILGIALIAFAFIGIPLLMSDF